MKKTDTGTPWRELYKAKLTTAEEAVQGIESNTQIFIGHMASEPQRLVEALLNRASELRNIRIIQMQTFGEARYCEAEYEGIFRLETSFAGASTRRAVQEGRADFVPMYFHKIPELYREQYNIHTALVQLSPPNDEGYCSYGLDCDCTKAAAESADYILAEINDNMPFVYGDNLIHVSELSQIVEASYALPVTPTPPIGDRERKIGEYCAGLVPDGATLQLGIGAIPDSVLLALKGKKDLGLHTEMFSDYAVELIRSGVINGKNKALHPGKHVASFLMGGKALYDFADHNPDVELYPVDYVNDPLVIMKNNKMISINTCIEVDFYGQVAAESIGGSQFSGVGGQVDFIRGSSMSEGGISIMAMASTTAKGKSKIVPQLSAGTPVTTSRCDVDYVVTEYGVARLRGLSLRERAKKLIEIAHPDVREELTASYNALYK